MRAERDRAAAQESPSRAHEQEICRSNLRAADNRLDEHVLEDGRADNSVIGKPRGGLREALVLGHRTIDRCLERWPQFTQIGHRIF
ncbi:MAG: hypothetical protein QOH12_1397 [Solirubrobacteraceae bacterium]|nr:hypothetical protein [Solirubrobacteraceae bacterium]